MAVWDLSFLFIMLVPIRLPIMQLYRNEDQEDCHCKIEPPAMLLLLVFVHSTSDKAQPFLRIINKHSSWQFVLRRLQFLSNLSSVLMITLNCCSSHAYKGLRCNTAALQESRIMYCTQSNIARAIIRFVTMKSKLYSIVFNPNNFDDMFRPCMQRIYNVTTRLKVAVITQQDLVIFAFFVGSAQYCLAFFTSCRIFSRT